jgi:hypothetical protein
MRLIPEQECQDLAWPLKPKKYIIMRKYLWIAVLISACNGNEGNNTTASKDSGIVAEKGSPASSGACNKLIFFKEGSEIETKTYNATGEAISTQVTKILAVKNEDGMTVANAESTDTQNGDGKEAKMTYDYKCDGNKIYFDITSLFRTEAKKSDASFKASVIEYPINVTAGETLPDASGTMSSETNGKKMEMKYHYKDRKVEAKEEITTPAGTFNCYKISNRVEVEMDIPGMDEKAKKIMEAMTEKMKTTSSTWFAPDFGIVKMEMYQNGKLQSKTEVTGVKR